MVERVMTSGSRPVQRSNVERLVNLLKGHLLNFLDGLVPPGYALQYPCR